jgi:hypothetical protein
MVKKPRRIGWAGHVARMEKYVQNYSRKNVNGLDWIQVSRNRVQ